MVKMFMLIILDIKVLSLNWVYDFLYSFDFYIREYLIQLNLLEKKYVNCYEFLVNIFCYVNIFVVNLVVYCLQIFILMQIGIFILK